MAEKILVLSKKYYKNALGFLVILLVTAAALILQPDLIKGDINIFEANFINKVTNWQFLRDNVIFAPYTTIFLGLFSIFDNPIVAARYTSLFFGLVTVALLYQIIRLWINPKYATIASLLYATSFWLLSAAHQRHEMILYQFAVAFGLSGLFLFIKTRLTVISLIYMIFAIALTIYIPIIGLIGLLLMAIAFFIKRKDLKQINLNGYLLVGIVFLVTLAPLIYGLITNPDQIKSLLGIQAEIPSLNQYAKNIGNQTVSIFVYTKQLPEAHLIGKPLIDIFIATMFVLGMYRAIKNRLYSLIAPIILIIITTVLLSGLSNNYLISTSALNVIIYIFAIFGVYELMERWNFVFPRNMLLRTTASFALVVVIGLSVFYNLQKFYIAWPSAPKTVDAYMLESNKE